MKFLVIVLPFQGLTLMASIDFNDLLGFVTPLMNSSSKACSSDLCVQVREKRNIHTMEEKTFFFFFLTLFCLVLGQHAQTMIYSAVTENAVHSWHSSVIA